MSSPLKFPDSDPPDVDMEEDATFPDAPAQQQPLFLASTPSAAGTPSKHRGGSVAASSPGDMSGLMARRAVGMETPRRKTPLFARKS